MSPQDTIRNIQIWWESRTCNGSSCTYSSVIISVKGKVKQSLCLTNYALRHEDVWGTHVFLTLALVGGECSASRPGRSIAGLDDMEKSKFLTPPGLEVRPFGHQVRSQSLYRLTENNSHSTARICRSTLSSLLKRASSVKCTDEIKKSI
jgi:hypothetical protein